MGKSKKPDWRGEVRRVMYEAARAQASADSGFNYRWEHVQAVVVCAVKLAKLTGADCDVVEAAAWLHDIRKETGDRHPKEGGKYARKFLTKTDFPKKKIDAVAAAIEQHMGLWRDTPLTNLEAQVLWDADKLTKIGLTALLHWTGADLQRGRTTTTDDMIARLKSADYRKKTVASMHTQPAKRAAKERFRAYNQFLKKVRRELSADDLFVL